MFWFGVVLGLVGVPVIVLVLFAIGPSPIKKL